MQGYYQIQLGRFALPGGATTINGSSHPLVHPLLGVFLDQGPNSPNFARYTEVDSLPDNITIDEDYRTPPTQVIAIGSRVTGFAIHKGRVAGDAGNVAVRIETSHNEVDWVSVIDFPVFTANDSASDYYEGAFLDFVRGVIVVTTAGAVHGLVEIMLAATENLRGQLG